MLRKNASWACDDVGSETVGSWPGVGVLLAAKEWCYNSWICSLNQYVSYTRTHSYIHTPHSLFLSHLLSHSVFHKHLSNSVSRTHAVTHSHPFFPLSSLHHSLAPSLPDSFIMADTASTLALIERWTSLFGLNPSPCHLRRRGGTF